MGDARFVSADGHRLEVRWHGPAPSDAPTLVFLHEGLGSAEQWRDFPAALADACGCGALVYSRWGYGRSEPVRLPRPLTYMHEEGDRVVGALLDACGVKRCVLVGHSDGASIAIVHAGVARGEAKRRIAGLALEAPHVFTEPAGLASIAKAKVAYETGDLRERLAKYHDDVDGAFRGWNDAWLDPEFARWNIEEYLPCIAVPVLVVQGEDDPYGTVKQVDAIERGVRGAFTRVMLAGCGHAPHRERPGETLAAMTALVKDALRDDAGSLRP